MNKGASSDNSIKYGKPDNWLGQKANESYWLIFSCHWKTICMGGLCVICSQMGFMSSVLTFIILYTVDRTMISQQDATEKQVKTNIHVLPSLNSQASKQREGVVSSLPFKAWNQGYLIGYLIHLRWWENGFCSKIKSTCLMSLQNS